MDRRFYDVAVAGSVILLLKLIEEDSVILDRVLVATVSETPLHIAAILGHLDFAREILRLQPKFAYQQDSCGFLPLHMAVAKGFSEMVKLLLTADVSGRTVTVRDGEGRTALHTAAIRGDLPILKLLLEAKNEASRIQVLRGGETILHLCAKHDHLDMVMWVVEWATDIEFLNIKDDDGNTALHILIANKHIQGIQLLVSKRVDVNARNNHHFTPLDVLLQNPSELTANKQIQKILQDVGAMAMRSKDAFAINVHSLNHEHQPFPNRCSASRECIEEERKQLLKRLNTVMVVAILIATVSFEAGLNPPNGKDKKDDCNCNHGKLNTTRPYYYHFESTAPNYNLFMVIDISGFLASLSVIILIISKPLLQLEILLKVVMVLVWISVCSVALTFSFLVSAMTPTNPLAANVPRFWVALLFFCLSVRLVFWMSERKGFGVHEKKVKGLQNENGDGDVELGNMRSI